MNNEHTVAPKTTLQSLKEEARKEWDRMLECLPPQWCSDCKTLGCGFGEEDRICGNCNGTHVVAFKVALDTLIEKAFAAGKEEATKEIMEFLKAEKSTYREDVAKRERDVYDHLILCLKEELPAPITH